MINKARFKAALALKNGTMAELADYMGISLSTLYRKINGKSDFTRTEIQKCCRYLNVSSPIGIFFEPEYTDTQEYEPVDHCDGNM